MRRYWIAALLAIGSGNLEASSVISFSGPGGAFPDATDASTPGVFTSDIMVADPRLICSASFQPADCVGPNANNVVVTISGLQHPWVGDVIATLTNVTNSTSGDLFNRVGRTTSDPNDVGDGGMFGDNLSSYSFSSRSSSFSGDLWTVASGLGVADSVPSGNYWTSTAGSGNSTSFLMAYNGLPAAGDWRLTLSDNFSDGDGGGSFISWTMSFNVTDVPEPSLGVPVGVVVLGLVLVGRVRSTIP
jgi:hypothetical protein